MELSLFKEKMENTLSFFERELSSVRTSRASVTMLDNIQVDSYGAKTPPLTLSSPASRIFRASTLSGSSG